MSDAIDPEEQQAARLQRPLRPDYAGRIVTLLIWSVILAVIGGGGYLVYWLGFTAYSDVHFLTEENIASLPPGSTLIEARKQFNDIGMPYTLFIKYQSVADREAGVRIADDLMSGRSEHGWRDGRFTGFAKWRDPERVAWGLYHEGFLVAPIAVVSIDDVEPSISQTHLLDTASGEILSLETIPSDERQTVQIPKRDPLLPPLWSADSHVIPFDLKERRLPTAELSPLPDAVEAALVTGTEFELFSLSPEEQENLDETRGFHGWEILGSTSVNDQTRTKLLTAFRAGVEENDGSVAACFEPRHGIRVKDDGKTNDFVICFTCNSVAYYVDGVRSEPILITDSPRAVFDGVLKAANVPLPKPPPE